MVDSSCPENIGSSTVSKVSYSNSYYIFKVVVQAKIISFHFQGAFSGTSQVQCCMLSTIK